MIFQIMWAMFLLITVSGIVYLLLLRLYGSSQTIQLEVLSGKEWKMVTVEIDVSFYYKINFYIKMLILYFTRKKKISPVISDS